MQHFPSSKMEEAYNNGHDYSLGTHTGILYYPANVYPKGSKHGANRWQVAHNVAGTIHVDKFNTLQYKGNPQQHEQGNDVALVTTVMRPIHKGRVPIRRKLQDKKNETQETVIQTGKKIFKTIGSTTLTTQTAPLRTKK